MALKEISEQKNDEKVVEKINFNEEVLNALNGKNIENRMNNNEDGFLEALISDVDKIVFQCEELKLKIMNDSNSVLEIDRDTGALSLKDENKGWEDLSKDEKTYISTIGMLLKMGKSGILGNESEWAKNKAFVESMIKKNDDKEKDR